MDVYGIEALLGLPEFRVFDQVIRPTQLDLHPQRRDAVQHRLERRLAFAVSINERELYISIGAENLTGGVTRLALQA